MYQDHQIIQTEVECTVDGIVSFVIRCAEKVRTIVVF